MCRWLSRARRGVEDGALLDVEAASLVAVAAVIGSFLGVVVRRLPEGKPIICSRSRCESCQAVLAARDLVPLASWFRARGRCRLCGIRLGWFYPAIEIAALLIALIALAVDGVPRAWLDCLFGWWLLTLGWIDWRHWVLPDALTLPLIVGGLVTAALFDPDHVLDRALGAALGYLAMRAIATAYRATRGRDGLGGGDAKLLCAAGAWLGLAAVPQTLLGAALVALAAVGGLRLGGIRLGAQSALPFGPFIAAAAWALWLWGPLSL
ncbi:MAG TPA: prepilin peptidase [Stellaceae bacterium]|nr:prepilin peptidase [Stellaceae bacterium]